MVCLAMQPIWKRAARLCPIPITLLLLHQSCAAFEHVLIKQQILHVLVCRLDI